MPPPILFPALHFLKSDPCIFRNSRPDPPGELLAFAEELEIENASNLRKQDMMFAILKTLAEKDTSIYGDGVLETLQDGFGFLRSPEANYLPGPGDIYVSQIGRASCRERV